MRSLARLRPSPSMAVALTALFVALGGVGYAAATIDSGNIVNNSIKSKDIKNNAVSTKDVKDKNLKGKDLANQTVTGGKIADGSIFTNDVADNALTGLDIDEATIGAVNFAQSAGNAGSAGNATTVSTVRTIPVTTVAEGAAPVVLASNGPFVIRGVCVDEGAATRFDITIDSSENDTTVAGETTADTDFDAADAAAVLSRASDPLVGGPTASGYDEGLFNAFATGSGTGAMTGNITGWASASAVTGGGRCKFHGSLVRSG